MNERDFLARVARRLGRPEPLAEAPVRDAVGAPEFWCAYQLTEDERVAKFVEELEKLGGQAVVCETLAHLHGKLRQWLAELGPSVIGMWSRDVLAAFELDDVLAPYETVVWDEVPAEHLAVHQGSSTGDARQAADGAEGAGRRALVERMSGADVGITACDYAVADTGSIVLLSGPGRSRSVSLLPSVHMVLIRASQIRTRLGEVLAELDRLGAAGQVAEASAGSARGIACPGGPLAAPAPAPAGAAASPQPPTMFDRAARGLPSSVNFITGPSRSSDIENDLTIGIHGPAAVMALIWRDGR